MHLLCCIPGNLLIIFTQGEPGYVIAGTDSNFVPGRKGEPGSSVSLHENTLLEFLNRERPLKVCLLRATGSSGTSWHTRRQWGSRFTRSARTSRATRNIFQGTMDQIQDSNTVQANIIRVLGKCIGL